MNYREQFETLRGEPYIRAVNLVGMKEFYAEHGCNILELMQEVGIPGRALDDLDSLISFRAMAVMSELFASRYNLPHAGMQMSARSAPEYAWLGPSILMANFVGTLGQWGELALRYWAFHTNGFKLEDIEPEGTDKAILRIHFQALVFPARQFIEATVANIVGVSKVICDRPDLRPNVVRFQHRGPMDTRFHEQFFECPVEFNCEHVEVEFDRKIKQYETKGSMRIFKPLMQLYIGERIRRMKLFDHTMASTVALAITSMLGSGRCGQETVAASLQISPKKMQRQLGKEGTNFSELIDKVRQRIANQLLIETDAPVSQIAGLLDYASPGPFIVAFQRWEDISPLQYRKRQRELMSAVMTG